MCVRMCIVRYEEVAKDEPHIVHVYGFSPVCTLLWAVKTNEWANRLPTKSQMQLSMFLIYVVFTTNVACVFSLSCVYFIVGDQTVGVCKTFTADITNNWFFSCVCPHVNSKVGRLIKPFSAYCTQMLLLPAVSSHVFH